MDPLFFACFFERLLRGNHRMDAFVQSFSLACPMGMVGYGEGVYDVDGYLSDVGIYQP